MYRCKTFSLPLMNHKVKKLISIPEKKKKKKSPQRSWGRQVEDKQIKRELLIETGTEIITYKVRGSDDEGRGV